MLLLIKNVYLHDPRLVGSRDLLLGSPEAGGRILAISEHSDGLIDRPGADGRIGDALSLPCDVIDGSGLLAVPGFIDNHVHVIGGGGEGGWATRTPELRLVDATLAGVTTVVGVLGTDGVARSMESLVAKTLALREEGISAWCYTGSYRLPLITITGDALRDLMLVEPVIGIGEVAVSDHRSSKPRQEELARLASEARVGGMLAGKAGIVNIHLGDAPAGFEPLRALVAAGDLPIRQLLPTHCGRTEAVFAGALDWLRAGGVADFTTSTVPAFIKGGEVSAGSALARIREAGISLDQVSLSSDGQGSLPLFDAQGRLSGVTVGTSASLLEAIREAVALGVPLPEALATVTANPAGFLRLERKGRLVPGKDADLVLLEPGSLAVRHVIAGGRFLVREGRAVVRGAFDGDGPMAGTT
jgi:beta-aspartyl-dipeptidase (metallo-type)